MTSVRGATIRFILFLIVLSFPAAIIVTTLQASVKGDTRSFVAIISDVSGLFVGNDVRIAGVQVGKVESIELDNGNARVRFSVVNDQPVYKSTGVAVYYQSLIGQKYLALTQDSPPAELLDANAEIPLDKTVPAFDITKLFNGFKPLFATLDAGQLNQLGENILRVIQGDGSGLGPVLADLDKLTKVVNDREGIIVLLIRNLGTISDEIGGKSGQVGALMTQIEAVSNKFTGQISEIVTSIESAHRVIVPAAQLLEQLAGTYDDNYGAMDALLRRLFPQTGQAIEILGMIPGLLTGLNTSIPAPSGPQTYACSAGAASLPGVGNVLLAEQQLVVCN